jgi:hypothetical protein
VCRLARYIRKRRIVTEFFRRVEAAACPGMGPAGIQWVFFGDANYDSSRRGNRSSPGAKTMMAWARQRYKWWDGACGEWKTSVVAVNEHGTSQCCPWCGERQKEGRAKKERRTKGDPEPPPEGSGKWWEWQRYEAELRRCNRWKRRGAGYESKSHAVRGLKVCCSRSCGRRLNSRDGGSTWCILVAGRADVEERERPAQLRPAERPERPDMVGVLF